MNTTANNQSLQLPTFQQLAAMFLERAACELSHLQDIRKRDDEWIDKDSDIDQMLDLTFERVLAMRAVELGPQEEFAHAWFKLSAVVNSSSKLFSRPGSWYGRTLNGLAEFFRQAPEMLEYSAQRS